MATVVGTAEENGSYSAELFLVGRQDRLFIARLPQFTSAGRFSDPLHVELWSGRVTRLGDITTQDNPEGAPAPGILRAIGLLLVVVGAGAIIWTALIVRSVPNAAESDSSTLDAMNPIATSDALWR